MRHVRQSQLHTLISSCGRRAALIPPKPMAPPKPQTPAHERRSSRHVRYRPLDKEMEMPASLVNDQAASLKPPAQRKKSQRNDMIEAAAGFGYGIGSTRQPYLMPPRVVPPQGLMQELCPLSLPSEECLAEQHLRSFCGRFGCSMTKAMELFRENNFDYNKCLYALEKKGVPIPRHSYGLVALENYAPEVFALLHVTVPSFEATRDPDTLEALHEIVLSAAEIPLDERRKDVVGKLTGGWDVEDGTLVSDILRDYNINVVDCILLAHGEYSTTGFHVHGGLDSLGFPNVGHAASAVACDLRTGVHSRFRFQVEKMCDSIAEHVNYESLHVGSMLNSLRQPFWFDEEYSLEEFIRFRENQMQPSAAIEELRYAHVRHGFSQPGYRNVLQLDKLRFAQNRLNKDWTHDTSYSLMRSNMSAAEVYTTQMPYHDASIDRETTLNEKSATGSVGAVAQVGILDRTQDMKVMSKLYKNRYY